MSSELTTRITSGVILGSLVIICTVLSPITFAIIAIAGWYVLISEWNDLTRLRSRWFTPLGAVYITGALLALTYLRVVDMNILLAVLAIVWTGDIAAYFVGKRFGKHKIAPTISPGKSWEGLAGSVVASAIVGAALGHVAPVPHAILGALFALLGLGGDLFESALKRHAGVKDSGTVIPGHGGLFDRVDALLPCAIFAAVALYIRLNMH